MKVWISNYRNHWYSPYTWIDYLFWWKPWSRCSRWTLKQTVEDQERETSLWVDRPEWCDRWADRLMPVSQAIQWVLDRVHPRIEYVKIDRWDTWSMDSTLAPIILPMLRQLRETTHGAPFVDPMDVPEHLRPKRQTKKERESGHTDSTHFERWDWVLGEMIFAFEMKCRDDWTQDFHSGEIDIQWIPVDKDNNPVEKKDARWYRMERGPRDTRQWDHEGQQRVQERITNGFRLFGKYYEALWS